MKGSYVIMKKEIKTSTVYLILALVSGVFYREFTKWNGFTGTTALSKTHLHLFVLGTLLYLVLALFVLNTDLGQQKGYKRFQITYNIALPFMVVMFYVRGIIQVLAVELSRGMDAAISGISGVAHILVAVSYFFLFRALLKTSAKK